MIRMYHKILFLCLVLALNNTSGQKPKPTQNPAQSEKEKADPIELYDQLPAKEKPAQSPKKAGPQNQSAKKRTKNGDEYYDGYSYEDPYWDNYV